ncbi:ABC transporter permease [Streptomyces sp. NPDC020898]|uniref:ABC transporter permease n=1 Tax=Streptomyces sp. NPDC020898 TaxID=3365101 RepID=UPI0037AEF54D
MSTTTLTAASHRVTTPRVLHAEWHKLRTLRSTWITLLAGSALTIATGITIGATYTPAGGDSDMDPVLLVLIGTQFTQISLAVLAILVTAGEYPTGMIRATMTAVPRRPPVLWAKSAVFAATAFATSLATAFITFPSAQLFLQGTDQETSLTDPGILRTLFTSSAGLTLLGLLALGLGALLRSVPGANGAFIGGVMILPEVLRMLPYDVVADAAKYFPAKCLETLTTAHPDPGAPSPGMALLAMALWAASTLTPAALLLKHRDV